MDAGRRRERLSGVPVGPALLHPRHALPRRRVRPWGDPDTNVGNPAANYTYLLRGPGCADPSAQRVAEFDFTLTPGSNTAGTTAVMLASQPRVRAQMA